MSIELDDVVADAPAVPIPLPTVTKVGEVNQQQAVKLQADADMLAKAGFVDQDRFFFALGTRIAEGGVQATNALRQEVEARPFIDAAIGEFLEKIKLEERANHGPFDVRDLRVSADGERLAVVDGKEIVLPQGRPTELAWSHIGERLGWPGLSSFLPQAPAETRQLLADVTRAKLDARYQAAVAEYEKDLAEREERRARDPKAKLGRLFKPQPPRVTFGTRTGMGDRKFDLPQVFRAGGPRYLDLGPQVVLPKVLDALPKSMRATLTYDGNAYSIEAVAASPIAVDGFVGEAFRAGIRVYGNDVKQGRLVGSAFLDRTRCLNGTVVPAELAGFALIHSGNIETVGALMEELLGKLTKATTVFIERWADMKRTNIVDENRGLGPRAILSALLEARLITVPGTRESALDAFERAWQVEPAFDVTSIVNAITRSAQTDWWQDVDQQNTLETQAGELLFVKNLVPRVQAIVAARAQEA
jgi:hypothetical protein